MFLGIPYAMPPTGDARLMPPRPHRGWQTYDAVDWAPVCPQPIKYVGATKNSPVMDEDCLYLNVAVPRNLPQGNSSAVLVSLLRLIRWRSIESCSREGWGGERP